MQHKILSIKDLDESVFVLRLERNELAFQPGQYLTLSIPESFEKREYTIYSSPNEGFLEFLVKDVAEGDVSRQLHQCKQGEKLLLQGPFGKFTIPKEQKKGKFLFVATGTGISPFHSFVASYPDLDYTILHGVRFPNQLYGKEIFAPNRHIDCLSKSNKGKFHGRVTDYLRENNIPPSTYCYFCGSSDMIYEAFSVLQGQGLPRSQMFTETYF